MILLSHYLIYIHTLILFCWITTTIPVPYYHYRRLSPEKVATFFEKIQYFFNICKIFLKKTIFLMCFFKTLRKAQHFFYDVFAKLSILELIYFFERNYII